MQDELERYMTWVLVIALMVSLIAVLALAVNPPRTTDPYTEFYVLGESGQAAGYPVDLSPGESGTVIIGITNHEHRQMIYPVVVTWNGSATTRRSVTVPAGETRETNMTLTAPQDPGRYRVRFLLYRESVIGGPYRTLRLWVTVDGASDKKSVAQGRQPAPLP